MKDPRFFNITHNEIIIFSKRLHPTVDDLILCDDVIIRRKSTRKRVVSSNGTKINKNAIMIIYYYNYTFKLRDYAVAR